VLSILYVQVLRKSLEWFWEIGVPLSKHVALPSN